LLKNWKCSIFSFFSSASEKKRKKRITFKKEGRKRIFIAKEEKEEKEEEWVARSITIHIVNSEGEGGKQFRHGIPELDRSGIGGNWKEFRNCRN